MARNYAALPHEYLEEMDILSDAEFGRLCRALLAYSMDGREGQLEGAEKVLWKRVKKQEDRFRESYKEQMQSRRSAGKKGAEKRWHSIADDGTAIADDGTAIADDGTAINVMACYGKNGYTKTETKTETKTDILPPDGGKNIRAREPAVDAVQADYLNRINPSASPASLDELAGFVEAVGPEVCKRAFDVALDSKKTTWPYIRAILQDKQRRGVKCLADWDALEKKRDGATVAGDDSGVGWMKKYIQNRNKDSAWSYVETDGEDKNAET